MATVAATTLVVALLVPASLASTHWVVTDEGKIQANVNSVFDLKRPHDLVALLKQEERLATLDQLKEELVSKGTLESMDRWQQDVSLESSLFENDEDCLAAGGPLSEFDLFASTMVFPEEDVLRELIAKILVDDEDDITLRKTTGMNGLAVTDGINDFGSSDSDDEQGFLEPSCFSLPSFRVSRKGDDFMNRLESLKDADKLQMMGGEEAVLTAAVDGHVLSLPQYGHLTAKALHRLEKRRISGGGEDEEKDSESLWVACLFAANYWRVRGDAAEAIDCSRKAIERAPDGQQYMGMVALASVLHRSHRSEDAEKVLLQATPLAPRTPAVFFALANVQSSLLKFKKAVANFDKVLELQPGLEPAKLRRHAVLCHIKVEQGLEAQHEALQNTLEELRRYREIHDQWSSTLSLILNEQSPLDARLRSGMDYEYIRSLIYQEDSKSGGGRKKNNNSGGFQPLELMSDCQIKGDEISCPEVLGKISVQDGVMRLDIKTLSPLGSSSSSVVGGDSKRSNKARKANSDRTSGRAGSNGKASKRSIAGKEHPVDPESVNSDKASLEIPTGGDTISKGSSSILDDAPPPANSKQFFSSVSFGANGMDSGGLASSEGLVALEDLEQLRRRKEKSPVFRLTDTISLSHRWAAASAGGYVFPQYEDDEIMRVGASGDTNFVAVMTAGDKDVLGHRRIVNKVYISKREMAIALPPGTVEVGAISLTDDHDDPPYRRPELSDDQELFEGDKALERTVSGYPSPFMMVHLDPASRETCLLFSGGSISIEEVRPASWISPKIKGLDFGPFLRQEAAVPPEGRSFEDEASKDLPFCQTVPTSMRTPDHLLGLQLRHRLKMDPETQLTDTLLSIGSPEGSAKTRADSLGEMGAWIANGLKGDPTSWMLSTAASLYWRVVGMPDEAVACLRHALHYCPQSYRDIPLFGLSDVFLASGLNNHALILAHSALDLTDNFLINFAIGCIHVRKGNYEKAKSFFFSTLKLQPMFQPARSYLMVLDCNK